MMNFLRNVLTLCRKEMLILLKDPRSRVVLIVPIAIQSLLFGYVATYDLNDVSYAVLDEDHSQASRDLIARFDGTPTFQRKATLGNTSQIAAMLDEGEVILVLHIGPRFEQLLMAGQTSPVQVLVDGRNSNVAGNAAGYASQMIAAFNSERLRAAGAGAPTLEISSRAWFNPNLETRWNFISGLLVVLSMVQVMVLTSLSVSREKEQGSFDQLLVTPFTPMVILFGKALPPVVVGLFQSTLVLLIGLYWFNIDFVGSYLLLYAGLLVFNLALVGIGLCISTLTSTMQQSMLYSFSLIMTIMLLSGFTTPISSMPVALQYATLANPARYGIEIVQRIYLEGIGLEVLYPSYLSLVVIAVITLGAASRLFRSRL